MTHLMHNRELYRTLPYIKRRPLLYGPAANLPDAFKRFWDELYVETPTPVHWKPNEGRWTTDQYGVVKPIQNVPVPVHHPEEIHEGIWGGEAVIQGFKQVGNKYVRRTAKWWLPTLRESVLYSTVLNKHMKVIVTDRTISLVHQHHGLDHYLLKTKACDLVSWLALRLKRKILLCIRDDTYPYEGDEREFVKKEYECYLSVYDPEYIEWYGLTMEDAVKKFKSQNRIEVKPMKDHYRQKLLEDLRNGTFVMESPQLEESKDTSLLSKPSQLLRKIKSKVM